MNIGIFTKAALQCVGVGAYLIRPRSIDTNRQFQAHKRSSAQTASHASANNDKPLVNEIDLMQHLIVKTDSQTPTEFDSVSWAQLNPWLVEGQADDRIPMNGSVKDCG